MGKRKGNVPDDADKLQFAEDIVTHIMNNIFDSFYEANRTEPYPEVMYKAFNETVREAVNYLFCKIAIVINDFLNVVDEEDSWDDVTYLECTGSLEALRFKEGFEARNFLCFCIEVTLLAYKFRNNGLLDAPDMAVKLIYFLLQTYDMFSGGWDALNRTASRWAFNGVLTRESTFPELADSKIENKLSQSRSSDKHSDNKDAQKTDKYDFSFNENKSFSKMLVPETEFLTSVFIDDMIDQPMQLDDIGSFGKAEKCGTESEMARLETIFTDSEDTEGGNLQ